MIDKADKDLIEEMKNTVLPDGLRFEEAIERLEMISARLSNENVPLDEAITLYELGVSYYNVCKRILDDANRRIKVIEENSFTEDES